MATFREPSRRQAVRGLAAVLGACADQAAAAQAVHLSERVSAPGASLYLDVRGWRRDAPILVWLHGGPGGAERPLFELFNAELERRFIVAYLDQRGAGRSFDPKADPADLTIARHLADLDLVVDHLLGRFGQAKVVLVGHSWGSALGLLYAKAHPRKVAAFVGVGQVTSELARQRSQYAFVADQARAAGDEEVLARLERIGAPPFTADQELAVQKLVDRYHGYWKRPPDQAAILARGLIKGLVRPWEIPRFIYANTVSLRAMNAELLSLDPPATAPCLEVPVIFMLGRYDRQVDARLAAAYFDALQAPAKRIVWFERSAHNIPFEEPEAFDAAVVRTLTEVGVLR